MRKALKIHIQGLVQGVGFRPFVYRIAVKNNILGSVENRNDGVYIIAEATEHQLNEFITDIKNKAPQASSIFSIETTEIPLFNYKDFSIIKSNNVSDDITEVSPDIAVCSDCLDDMKNQEHRIDYPFINCTNCGPRFSIIKDLPYDREKTAMAPFKMCAKCNQEYTDILDRRFHAQPVACSTCGPHYTLIENEVKTEELSSILNRISQILYKDGIIAIKGMGGFHLCCNALSEKAVTALRKNKNREGKPLAVMFSDINNCKNYASVSNKEEELLLSWRKPIVLLDDKKKLAPSVNLGLSQLGCILPYMPLHYLLFENIKFPIVFTSGNLSDEPVIVDNEIAEKHLSDKTDAILNYNRDIANRNDDSVVKQFNTGTKLFRRSRGYAPSPIRLNFNVDGIIAGGAELVNCFCIGKKDMAFMSQHIGDLKNAPTFEFYQESIDKFSNLFRAKPQYIAADYHPDYLSTKHAVQSEFKYIPVRHHHAHIAACMAENNLPNENIIGISFDGTGLGDDNAIWGGEFLICNYQEYKRHSHFQYIPMPGGDKASKQPWRSALSYLYGIYGKDFQNIDIPFNHIPEKSGFSLLTTAIDKNINCPLTSSSGRLFDAVAALTGINYNATFHAEAPIRLESIIKPGVSEYYPFEITKTVSFHKSIDAIVSDIKKNTELALISAKFHNTVIQAALQTVLKISKETGINKVAVSGGTFQNKYLSDYLTQLLEENNFKVFSHSKIPANDGGLALGQLAIAACQI